MSSQDDLGMLWCGATGVSFNPADPTEVLLNTGTAAPMLSDHPRSLVVAPNPHPLTNAIHSTTTYASSVAHPQLLYDSTAPDYVDTNEYIYETYDGYEDSSSLPNMVNANSQVLHHQKMGIATVNEDDLNGNLKTKKPKVHHHPALKLKTPIAYQKDTDISAIPIMKEGMAVCKRCGAIGVKHAFYGKERKFCSLVCARPPHQGDDEIGTIESAPEFIPLDEELKNNLYFQEPTLQHNLPKANPTYLPPASKKGNPVDSFNWQSYLDDDFLGAPVNCFRHAPMSECWEHVSPGMKVEVSCWDESLLEDAFWVATVVRIEGYKAQLRYEGFVNDASKDFWVDLCSEEVHPVGWCATQEKPLIPPRSIQFKYKDWKEFLMRRLTGARTLPTNFHSRIIDNQKSRFRPGLNLEVVDKNRIAQMRVATVTEVVGKRLHLKYHGAPSNDNGFWCHEDSELIHPVGWSREVGHEIVASQLYHEKCFQLSYDPNDAIPDLFQTPSSISLHSPSKFAIGMKLEAIDPLNLSTICVATVMKILFNNYLMIRIDSYENDDTCSDWFCYHASSPCIFPAGFCESNNITLTPPKGFEGCFSWFTYLKKTQATVAPPMLFSKDLPDHDFEVGMHLEAVDLMDPRLICVASIKDIKGRLLKVHFDGWEEDFDQWVDCQSPDIYPVGWCKMVGYKLEAPKKFNAPALSVHNVPQKSKRGRRRKSKSHQNNLVITNNSFKSSLDVREQQTIASSEDDPASDETSSGVASLADSDVSTDCWDINDSIGNSSGLSENVEERISQSFKGTNSFDMIFTKSEEVPISHSNENELKECTTPPFCDSPAKFFNDCQDFKPKLEYNSLNLSSPNTNFIVDDNKVLFSHNITNDLLGSDGDSNSKSYLKEMDFKNEKLMCEMTIPTCTSNIQNEAPEMTLYQSSDLSTEVNAILDHSVNDASNSQVFENISTPKKFIPRIIDSYTPQGEKVEPNLWTVQDVLLFLQFNDCVAYCENFALKQIDGPAFLKLTQNDVLALTGMKVGPSLKIHDLIQQLLAVVNPAQARHQATLLRRGFSSFGKT